ncbi:MAG: hypothetical protein SGARI_000714 [Bacillariaceae sp.]
MDVPVHQVFADDAEEDIGMLHDNENQHDEGDQMDVDDIMELDSNVGFRLLDSQWFGGGGPCDDDNSCLPIEELLEEQERYRKLLEKLVESMKKSQETRKSLKTEKYNRSEKSSKQLQKILSAEEVQTIATAVQA